MCQSVNFYGNKWNRKEENERIKEENEGGIVNFAFYERGFVFFRNNIVQALKSFVFFTFYRMSMIDFGFSLFKRFNLLPAAQKFRNETRKGARRRWKKRADTEVFQKRPV